MNRLIILIILRSSKILDFSKMNSNGREELSKPLLAKN